MYISCEALCTSAGSATYYHQNKGHLGVHWCLLVRSIRNIWIAPLTSFIYLLIVWCLLTLYLRSIRRLWFLLCDGSSRASWLLLYADVNRAFYNSNIFRQYRMYLPHMPNLGEQIMVVQERNTASIFCFCAFSPLLARSLYNTGRPCHNFLCAVTPVSYVLLL